MLEIPVDFQIDILGDIFAIFFGRDEFTHDLSHQPLGLFNQATEGVHIARQHEVDKLSVRGYMLWLLAHWED